MIALPIPDKRSPTRYRDLAFRGRNLGSVVERLTKGRWRPEHRAHLDPDLRHEIRTRDEQWRAALGQGGAAQAHLRNQCVGPGDLFLFWGLFRPVDEDLCPQGPPAHYVWGWLQVDEVIPVDEYKAEGGTALRWASQHPHLHRPPDPRNTLYVATDRLRLPGTRNRRVPGWGVFDSVDASRRLSDVGGDRPSTWRLPVSFLPGRRPALTYHSDPTRWSRAGRHAVLRTVARGQEYVLELDQYPEVVDWLADLLIDA